MKGIKTGGRQKGSLNRTTTEVQKALLKLLDDNLDKLQIDIDSMKGKDRASLIISLAKHCTPPALNPEKLTEEQLQQIIEYLKKQHNEETGANKQALKN
jgi:hypothetical protein